MTGRDRIFERRKGRSRHGGVNYPDRRISSLPPRGRCVFRASINRAMFFSDIGAAENDGTFSPNVCLTDARRDVENVCSITDVLNNNTN